MKKYSREISLYTDLLIIEALLSNTSLSKTAQTQSVTSSIVDKIKQLFGNHIDPDDKAGSVLNLLAPGFIFATLSALGFGKLGAAIAFVDSVFHWDVAGLLNTIIEKIKGEVSDGKQVAPEQVHAIVQSAVQEHNTEPTQEEAEKGIKMLKEKQQQTQEQPAQANDGTLSFARDLRFAKLLSLALDEKLVSSGGLLDTFFGKKRLTGTFFTRILSFLFISFLAAAGFTVLGDVTNKLLGRPNALDDTIQKGQPVEQEQQTVTTKQSKFKVNPSYQDVVRNSSSTNWVENVPNNAGSIGQMIVNFAKDVYQGLDGQESAIESSPRFQTLVETIRWYNHASAGGPIVFIPRMFTTKKQLVDTFISDVDEKAP